MITFTSCCILAVVIVSMCLCPVDHRDSTLSRISHAVTVKGYLRFYYINYVLYYHGLNIFYSY